MKKTADTLERGDVIRWSPGHGKHRTQVVVIEPSDSVTTMPHDQRVRGVTAAQCCEPRICFLGRTGRMTHDCTYIIVQNNERFEVVGFLDLDIRSAVVERQPLECS